MMYYKDGQPMSKISTLKNEHVSGMAGHNKEKIRYVCDALVYMPKAMRKKLCHVHYSRFYTK